MRNFSSGAQIAHALTEAGLKPGDRLAAQIGKSPEALALYAACVQAGIVIFLPLNTAYTVDELSYFIENSGATHGRVRRGPNRALTPSPKRLGAMVETLNGDGPGIPCGQAQGPAGTEFRPCRPRRGRSGGLSLHLRHDGALQGRDADPGQPAVQRRDAGGLLALHRRATSCFTRCRSSTPTGCSWRPT
jgi:acyl-CoA synthetase (AMP-forming)/AMP-acid ligase II